MSKIDYTIFDTLFDFTADATVVFECESCVIVYENFAAKTIKNDTSVNLLQLATSVFGVNELKEIADLPSFKEAKTMVAEAKHILPHTILYLQIEIRKIEWQTQYLWVLRMVNVSSFYLDNIRLQESERILHTVIDLVPEAIFLKDNQRKFLLVNKAFEEYHGLSKEAIIGKTDEDIKLIESEYSKFVNDDKEVIATGMAKHIVQENYTDQNGKNVFFKTTKTPFYFTNNETPGILGVAINITEKVAFKNKVISNRKMQRQIVDLVPHMIFLKDYEGKYMFVNNQFLKRTGKTEKEVIGKTDFDIFPQEKAQRYVNDDDEVKLTRTEKIIEKEFGPLFEGKITVYNTIKKPYYEYDTDRIGVLGISTDVAEKIRNKELLDEQKSILNEIINLLPQEIYLKDDEGKMLLVNKACADFHMMSQESMIGKSDYDFFEKKYADEFFQLEQEILKEGKTRYINEEISVDKHNVRRIKSVMKMPFYLNDRRKNGLLGLNIDITDAKNAQQKIVASEIRYKTLMEQASDGIYLSDDDGNIIEANQKACEMFGYSPKEFYGLNIKKLVSAEPNNHHSVRMPNAKDRQSLILERKFLKKDGSTFTVELSVKLLEDGMHQAIMRDVTERKKIEKILADNERKFRLLIENSTDLILILSQNFIIKFMSPSVSRILGYKEQNLIGTSILGLLDDEEFEAASQFFSNVLVKTNSLSLDELKFRNNNDDFLFFETVAVNMLDDENINGIIVNCHDVSKRKQTETELLNTNFELDSFVYKASHDLKAPLRSVMGLIKLAKLESADPNMEIYFDMMSKSVTSLDAFIKELTQFSRNSRLEIEPVEINFEAIIQEALDNLKFVENADKINVNIQLNVDTKFHSDKTRIATIINNLFSNAFKYHRFENNNPYLNVMIDADAEKAVIVVEDNGIGIEQSHINYIFDMFYRASETSYGSGLGLYILKSAITKIKGKVEVQSVLAQGTIFTVTLQNFLNKNNERNK